MANARGALHQQRSEPFERADLSGAEREGSGKFTIQREDAAPEAPAMPPLLTGLLVSFAAIAATGTALAALRVHAGARVGLLDLVSVGCLVLSTVVLLARRRIGGLLVDPSDPDDQPEPVTSERRSDFVVAPSVDERPITYGQIRKPVIQAVTLSDESEAIFEPALAHCPKMMRDAFLTTLRDLPSVSEVHIAKVMLFDSGRVARRVLVVAVGSALEAAEAHTALSAALENVIDEGEALPVWFVRHESARLLELRNAGCLVLRKRAARMTSLR